MIGRFAFLMLFLASITSANEALAQQQPLTEVELREVIVGKSVHWSSGSITDYRTDGTFAYRPPGKTINGKWTLSDNKFCYALSSGRSVRDHFYKDAKGPYNIDYNGKQFRFTVDGEAR